MPNVQERAVDCTMLDCTVQRVVVEHGRGRVGRCGDAGKRGTREGAIRKLQKQSKHFVVVREIPPYRDNSCLVETYTIVADVCK